MPLIAANLQQPNPVHRVAARATRSADLRRAHLAEQPGGAGDPAGRRPGLHPGLLSWLRQSRRAVAAERRHRRDHRLRNQIHRQMYRLGQSSLPTEGIGPVVNILTREVNDVRDGLIADLDVIPRMPVLAVGLLALAL